MTLELRADDPSLNLAQHRWCAVVSALLEDGESLAVAMRLAAYALTTQVGTGATTDADDTCRIVLSSPPPII